MHRIIFVFLFSLITTVTQAQRFNNLDIETLPGNRMVLLQRDASVGGEEGFRLFFTDVLYEDSLIIAIDSIDHVPCGGPNSLFFINDSVGFMMESGGCYAYYNWMYRTPDRGHTWKKVVFETNTELFPNLSNKNFYMFNNLRGIIIWQVGGGKIIYSTTEDGGFTWKREMKDIGLNQSIRIIDSIHFSATGQIIVIATEKERISIENKNGTIVISEDFGKTFFLMH